MVHSKRRFLVFVLNLIYECFGSNYKFETVMITSFSNAPLDRTMKQEIEEYSLNKLNREEKLRLCILAKKDALDKGMLLRYVDTEEKVKKYIVSKEETTSTKTYLVVGLKCPFVPFVLLHRKENSINSLMTIVQKNPFLDESYKFDEVVVDRVEHIQVVSSNSKLEWRNNYAYADHNYKTRWMMCVAATTRIRFKVTMQPSDEWLGIVGVYDVTYLTDSEESKMVTAKEVVAFPCNSSPMMYLNAVSSSEFVAILVRY